MAIEANTSLNRIEELKKHILKAFIESSQVPNIKGKSGVFIDQTYGQSVLNELTGQDFWIARPVEIPGSRPLRLEHGNIGSQLISWPIEQIVKCLVFYSPDDTYALRIEQEDQIKEVYDACLKSGHEMLLELIVNNDEHSVNPYVRSIQRIYNIGIKPDWWKIPPLSTSEWNKIDAIIDDRDPYCRGIVILGLGASKEKLYSGFKRTSASKYVKGFAVGRTIFSEPSKMWLQNQIDDNTLIKKIKENYIEMIQLWSNRKQ
jgi:5-dehydro-2-deoxygluconokinase